MIKTKCLKCGEKKKQIIEKELMMVAFGSRTTVLFVKGPTLEKFKGAFPKGFDREIEAFCVSRKGLDAPYIGIWVWEGSAKEAYAENANNTPDFSVGVWRSPILQEIGAVVAGYNPWSLPKWEGTTADEKDSRS